MIVTRFDPSNAIETYCGPLHELLRGDQYPGLSIAILFDIKETSGHYHTKFDEVYFMLDGRITLQLYDPADGRTSEEFLGANELCVIPKGVHHKVIRWEHPNRLCALCLPAYLAGDELPSDKI